MNNRNVVPVDADFNRSPTFILLAEMFDKAGINYDNTALNKIEPLMLEFLVEFSSVTIKSSLCTSMINVEADLEAAATKIWLK